MTARFIGNVLLVSLSTCAILGSPLAAEGTIAWEPYRGKALDGSPLSGELGRFRVPERHDRPAGRSIELAVVRFRTSHPSPGPPIIFLAGGPGGSGVEGAAVVATHPQIRLLEHRDVIGLDQRGAGLSRPDLGSVEYEELLPFDRAVTAADARATLARLARKTATDWAREGVDLEAYNTVESADDVEALRRALGVERIALWGASYGSHLGLTYLRRHGDHVERAVLGRVEGPNDTWKLPSTVQRHLEHLGRLVAADPELGAALPDVGATVAALLQRLEAAPVTVAMLDQDEAATVTIGPWDLRVWLAQALGDVATLVEVPAALVRFAAGDWRDLVATARENRRITVPTMPMAMDCASGATAGRWRRIAAEAVDPGNLLGAAIFAPFDPAVCSDLGAFDLGDDFRGPIHSSAPILFSSGTLDVRTPSENVEILLPGLPNAVHIVVENAAHEGRDLMSEAYRDLVQAFLRGEPVESGRISLPEPSFASVERE